MDWFKYSDLVPGWLDAVDEIDEREGAGDDVVAIVEPKTEDVSDPYPEFPP